MIRGGRRGRWCWCWVRCSTFSVRGSAVALGGVRCVLNAPRQSPWARPCSRSHRWPGTCPRSLPGAGTQNRIPAPQPPANPPPLPPTPPQNTPQPDSATDTSSAASVARMRAQDSRDACIRGCAGRGTGCAAERKRRLAVDDASGWLTCCSIVVDCIASVASKSESREPKRRHSRRRSLIGRILARRAALPGLSM
jgi:hypothetical protein